MHQHPGSEQLGESIKQLTPHISKYSSSLFSALKSKINNLLSTVRNSFSLSDVFEQGDKESSNPY